MSKLSSDTVISPNVHWLKAIQNKTKANTDPTMSKLSEAWCLAKLFLVNLSELYKSHKMLKADCVRSRWMISLHALGF